MSGADPSRVERAARNQVLFREVNERLQDLADAFHDVATSAVFACECAALDCVGQIEMSIDEYESVRSEANQFAVLPGHVLPDVEDVVSENERFTIVAKIGDAAKIAEEANPRG
jgi:hypothetical protein